MRQQRERCEAVTAASIGMPNSSGPKRCKCDAIGVRDGIHACRYHLPEAVGPLIHHATLEAEQ
jgi:hypothetical protein